MADVTMTFNLDDSENLTVEHMILLMKEHLEDLKDSLSDDLVGGPPYNPDFPREHHRTKTIINKLQTEEPFTYIEATYLAEQVLYWWVNARL